MNTGTIAGILGVGFIFLALKKANNPSSNLIEEESPLFNSKFSCKYRDTIFPLRYGTCGNNVRILQRFLNKSYSKNLVVDGAFGPKTKQALQTTTGKSVVTKQFFNHIQ